ncbi:formate C-acetyltransferase [Anaerovoracaceae bacterium 41-7]|jgi:formate C-acetyltransferase|uniref:Formate acetyltransferase n=1 Tax=Anaerotruncus colihominis TaxID=169435 RepID=A0A845QHA4_9FIRM|nr:MULTISPECIES: formate C-acetyltransferase [Clostridia]MCI9477282.1 formate C-acetyltransferase [Emergencia sp.]MCI9641096.1 formate C-acetyltransferase [Emergencia sp.]NBH61510.1 formate C-acetyltransferase [Anaerotruncus colihominis]NCF00495.1 formate C-acetyltransferase [Emergencia sp. 1XD21-10]NCF02165.1 formate C-acetyltransferase [Anaerotruncus sp. 80]
MSNAWEGFKSGAWETTINVDDFINTNYTPYDGDESFLAGPTARTTEVNDKVKKLLVEERHNGGTLKVDASRIMRINAFDPGYIIEGKDLIVGLQTDEPLKRGICPFGGIKMVREEVAEYGEKLPEEVEFMFNYVTSHNDGVFKAYSPEMRKARHLGYITGLPDAYGRGRIIGDYRRAALYGIDRLIEAKQIDHDEIASRPIMSEENVRLAEEIWNQIAALKEIKKMAEKYGYDISKPATDVREAIQWTYFAYLAGIKEENGAAMSLGRTATFIDVYAERDLASGKYTEEQIQEFIDDFILKLRVARHLRTTEYNELFGGDPMWITEGLGGVGADGRHRVTKMTYRYLNTLYNLGAAPEPNLTVLWSKDLPEPFKKFCAQVSIDTDSIQYENDDKMRPAYGEDYSIACCVSAIQMGQQMQFFGARCNLAKCLLLAINGGIDERTGEHIGPQMESMPDGPLDFDEVWRRYNIYLEWLMSVYARIMNIIHFMHDKYDYERSQMAFLDSEVKRLMAFGVAGFSVAADSLSAIKYAKVTPIRDENGVIVDFETEGDFPKYGNDDDRVDELAVKISEKSIQELRKQPAYRNAVTTLSVLTITSNVMYGKKTGNTPDGRRAGTPFAPGANPMHCRDNHGAVASLNSVAKIDWDTCQDGISNTFSITPDSLGKDREDRKETLVKLLSGYFGQGAHHLNVNVLNREVLMDAYENPDKYPSLTIRVSGYAVRFNALSKAHQKEVIDRTFHEGL